MRAGRILSYINTSGSRENGKALFRLSVPNRQASYTNIYIHVRTANVVVRTRDGLRSGPGWPVAHGKEDAIRALSARGMGGLVCARCRVALDRARGARPTQSERGRSGRARPCAGRADLPSPRAERTAKGVVAQRHTSFSP